MGNGNDRESEKSPEEGNKKSNGADKVSGVKSQRNVLVKGWRLTRQRMAMVMSRMLQISSSGLAMKDQWWITRGRKPTTKDL